LDDVAADSSCRVVVLTGAGRGFCAGADLKEGFGTGAEPGAHQVPGLLRGQYRLGELIGRMRSLRVPLVAAVNGASAGGGFALCLACDVRLASTAAKFLVANVKVGLSGGEMGISYLLPRIVGGGRASELMFTGRTVLRPRHSPWGS
jgi:enoyl-CoA hydratase